MVSVRERVYFGFILCLILSVSLAESMSLFISASDRSSVVSEGLVENESSRITNLRTQNLSGSPVWPTNNNEVMWNRTFGGELGDYCFDLVNCSDGGFVLAGLSVIIPGEDLNAWLVRTNQNGNAIWTKGFGGNGPENAQSVTTCSNGDIVFTGSQSGDMCLVRTDADGNTLWGRSYDIGESEVGYSVIECSDGGFAIIGCRSYSGTHGWTSDILLVRTESDGSLRWLQEFDFLNESDEARALIECSDGGFTFVGYSRGIDFQRKLLLVRTDDSGILLWHSFYNETITFDDHFGLVACRNGDYAILCQLYNYTNADYDLWLIRTDEFGNHLWNTTYITSGMQRASDLIECNDGGFALAGQSHTDSWNGLIVRTDNVGNHLWNYTFGGAGGDEVEAIVETGDGGFALAGTTQSYGAGSYDMWLIRVPDEAIFWLRPPTNQILEYGHQFTYQVQAIASYGIDTYWVNDSNHFEISQNGVISNSTTLSVGNYGLNVWANDTLGEVINCFFSVTIELATPPSWVISPENQIIEYGVVFRYQLSATDQSGLDRWWIDDTENFSINAFGLITNATVLQIGEYPIQVSVNDTLNNILTATFTVTVHQPPTPPPPPIPGFPFEALFLGLVVAIIPFLLNRRKR